jgi:hypothetical protein
VLVGHPTQSAVLLGLYCPQVASKLVFSADQAQLYFGSIDSRFYAVDVYTGVQHWVFEADGYVSAIVLFTIVSFESFPCVPDFK